MLSTASDEPIDAADPVDVAGAAGALLTALRRDVPLWVSHHMIQLGADPSDVGRRAWLEIERDLTTLLSQDIDEQRETPLTIVRRCATFVAGVLSEAGVSPVHRDAYDSDLFPEDVYALGPAAFSDLGEAVGDAGLRWSVAKAFEHRLRHQH